MRWEWEWVYRPAGLHSFHLTLPASQSGPASTQHWQHLQSHHCSPLQTTEPHSLLKKNDDMFYTLSLSLRKLTFYFLLYTKRGRRNHVVNIWGTVSSVMFPQMYKYLFSFEYISSCVRFWRINSSFLCLSLWTLLLEKKKKMQICGYFWRNKNIMTINMNHLTF